MNTHDIESRIHLRPGAYTLIGLALLALGLSISWVNGQFYIIGLGRIEPDLEARQLRTWYGILAVVAHLAFFFAAALLRHDRFRTARRMLSACALALLLLEIVTVYTTKVVLARSAETLAEGAESRVQQLQAQIATARSTAASLREAGAKSARSWIADSRADGARSIRDAADLEAQTAPLIAELARAQAQRRPTAVGVLGNGGVQLFSAAGAVAFILAGVAAVSVGGLLVGIARSHATAARAATAPASAAAGAIAPHRIVDQVTPPYSAARRWAAAGVPAAAIPAAAFAAPVMSVTAPAYPAASYSAPVATAPAAPIAPDSVHTPGTRTAPVSVQSQPNETAPNPVQSSDGSGGAVEQAPAKRRAAPRKPRSAPVEVGHKRDSGVGAEDGYRYRRIRDAVQAGTLTPSIRAIQAAQGGGTDIVRGYLQELERDGVIARQSRGYALRGAPVDQRQMSMAV
ncbi:hypothetical protein [Malikia sp.]|uniref:hypothetical protein n=1 Tax=Malikia sp. TaxID=2070706 RepID=UPI002617232C|nr:hypothetical protein [Malikia sp.]MDD2728339.1 hypothetical protein [Malikia sp.]